MGSLVAKGQGGCGQGRAVAAAFGAEQGLEERPRRRQTLPSSSHIHSLLSPPGRGMSKYKNSQRIGIGMEGGEGFAYSTRAQESLMPYMGILFAIVLFFILEKAIHFRHCHAHHFDAGSHAHEHHLHHPAKLAPLNLVGDGIHNFIDGIIIAGAFVVDTHLGLATVIAVIFHEIPQEMGDFSILIYSGMAPKRALFFNFLSALTAVVGAIRHTDDALRAIKGLDKVGDAVRTLDKLKTTWEKPFAIGIGKHLDEFSKKIGVSSYKDIYGELIDYARSDSKNIADAVSSKMRQSSSLHFNLEGFNIKTGLERGYAEFNKGIASTPSEFVQIINDSGLLGKTTFYSGGKAVSTESVIKQVNQISHGK